MMTAIIMHHLLAPRGGWTDLTSSQVTVIGGRTFRAQAQASTITQPHRQSVALTMTPEPSAITDDSYCISFDNVLQAAKRIEGIAHKTPVLTCTSLDGDGRRLFFKTEAMQRTGSFKFRGALNAIKTEVSNTSSPSLTVVTHSSGNHAAAVALAASLASNDTTAVSATIVMPNNAPAIKKAGVVGFGGTIVSVENTPEAREEAADEIMSKSDGSAVFVHPSEDPRVIAGQGTVSLELVSQIKEIGYDVDAVIIPVGGGGLASGNTVALRGLLGNRVKIILAEPAKLDDAKRSFESGQLMKHPPGLNTMDSVADGLRTTLGPNTWPIVRDMVDDIITVTEEDILRATKMVWERLKVCVEPSAGVGVAVAMGKEFNEKYPVSSGIKNVAVILCGGNVDVIKTAKLMEELGL